jgi:hypothetical protein
MSARILVVFGGLVLGASACGSAPGTSTEEQQQVSVPVDAGQDANGGDEAGDAQQQGERASDGGWGAHANVGDIFARNCSRCHGSQFATCSDAQSQATMIGSMVSGGAMPRGGGMSSEDKNTLLAWISAGAPCAGQ